jgi:hypothetical protein
MPYRKRSGLRLRMDGIYFRGEILSWRAYTWRIDENLIESGSQTLVRCYKYMQLGMKSDLFPKLMPKFE